MRYPYFGPVLRPRISVAADVWIRIGKGNEILSFGIATRLSPQRIIAGSREGLLFLGVLRSGARCISAPCVVFLLAVVVAASGWAQEVDSQRESPETFNVTFKSDEGTKTSVGEVLVDFPDGSLLLLTPDGQLWTLFGEDVTSKEPVAEPMQPLTSDEIFEQFQSQLPPGFAIHKTKHYVLVHNTSPAYADWVGQLFERLHRGFYNYWRTRNIKLEEPRFPLVAAVFRDKQSYLQFAQREIGDSAAAMIGYYNLKSNRMISYDLTGVNQAAAGPARVPVSRITQQILSLPQGERTVATIVHEAVHQIAFNSGLQVRLADNPKWVSEGMAMFFESPDFTSNSGWSMGKVNYHNLRLFAQYLPSRPADSLTTLISSDDRFNDASTANAAYSESWALTYYLMKTKKKEYSNYLQELATFEPLGESTERERVDLFKKHFGDDLADFDHRFIRYVRSIR